MRAWLSYWSLITPDFILRRKLATDPNVLDKTGKTLTAGELAEEYDFTDVDGRRIRAFEFPPGMARD